MEGGVDKFQILVVVLVVLAQAAGALRAWYRRHRERRREEEARLGLPGDRAYGDREAREEREERETGNSPELPDWDPFEEEPEAEEEKKPAPPPSRPRPLPVPVAAPQPVGSVLQDRIPAEVAENAFAHPRPASATSSPARETRGRLAGLSLRQAVLAREILSPPLSLRARGGSIGSR